MILLDTDVLVDCLRRYEPARAWLEASDQSDFLIPGIVAMELILGCQDQRELRECQAFMSDFDLLWPETADAVKAYELLLSLRLTSGIGIPDCLIGAMALLRRIKLYSFNLKHFRAIDGLDVEAPYVRVPASN